MIVDRLEAGMKDYRLYREGIKSFYTPYAAFERVWKHLLANPNEVGDERIYAAIEAIADPRFARTQAIADDLVYLYNNQIDIKSLPETKATQHYAKHIEKALKEKPYLVLAYAHAYYMAIFAGGKMLHRVIVGKADFFPINAPASTPEEAKIFATNMFVYPVDEKVVDLRGKFKETFAEIEKSLTEEEHKGKLFGPSRGAVG